jgi:16S rRNA (guanine527-N7)-methyltransferase
VGEGVAVSDRQVAGQISRRAEKAGVAVPAALAQSLEAYVSLLAKWNRKINLTSLPLDPPTDQAIDRLIVEPLAAARHVRASDRLMIDVGSGGGSPAIPFVLAAPQLRAVLVEVKTRKSAFLREVVRQLDLRGVSVETHLLEELLSRSELHEAADLVTVRAVRMGPALLSQIRSLIRPHGRVFWFGGSGSVAEAAALASANFRVEAGDAVDRSTGGLVLLVSI